VICTLLYSVTWTGWAGDCHLINTRVSHLRVTY